MLRKSHSDAHKHTDTADEYQQKLERAEVHRLEQHICESYNSVNTGLGENAGDKNGDGCGSRAVRVSSEGMERHDKRLGGKAEPDAAWKAIYFQPTFFNRNMKQEVMLSDDYRRMADRHGLFRLEPFLSRRMQDHAFTLSPQEQSLFAQYFTTIGAQLTG